MRIGIHKYVTDTFKRFGLIQANDSYNPTMVQKPAIGLGNTGRYVLDAFQVAYNSPARGTLAPNAPSSGTAFVDVNRLYVGPTQGFSIPNVPGRQGLVNGFRSNLEDV